MSEDIRRIRPGVGAIVVDADGQVLLHRRRYVGAGWAPPSGTVEPGESLYAAVHRELEEETSLSVKIGPFVGVYSSPQWQVVRYPDGDLVHFITSVFYCHKCGGKLDGSDEGIAWDWFDPDDLPGDLLPYAQVWLNDALGEESIPVVK